MERSLRPAVRLKTDGQRGAVSKGRNALPAAGRDTPRRYADKGLWRRGGGGPSGPAAPRQGAPALRGPVRIRRGAVPFVAGAAPYQKPVHGPERPLPPAPGLGWEWGAALFLCSGGRLAGGAAAGVAGAAGVIVRRRASLPPRVASGWRPAFCPIWSSFK